MVARLRDAIQRGTTAAKPAATAVDVGTLYFDTDLDKLQRSDGTNWQDVERADAASGTPTFVGAVAYHSTTQAITTATATALDLDSEDIDTNTFHDLVTNNSRHTIPTGKGGTYLVRAHTTFAANATNDVILFLRKNGSDVRGASNSALPHASLVRRIEVVKIVALAATDYIQAFVYQSTGGNLNVGDAADTGNQTTLELTLLGT